MTLKYIGTRQFEQRLAEFSYENHEEERFMKIASELEEEGYKIDTGIEGWTAIRVEDRKEFEEVKRDFQRLRRTIK